MMNYQNENEMKAGIRNDLRDFCTNERRQEYFDCPAFDGSTLTEKEMNMALFCIVSYLEGKGV